MKIQFKLTAHQIVQLVKVNFHSVHHVDKLITSPTSLHPTINHSACRYVHQATMETIQIFNARHVNIHV